MTYMADSLVYFLRIGDTSSLKASQSIHTHCFNTTSKTTRQGLNPMTTREIVPSVGVAVEDDATSVASSRP
jgi:hypothetical protein